MSAPLLLSLDPGIDATGYAVLRTDVRPGAMLHQIAPYRIKSGALKTPPDMELLDRLRLLSSELDSLFAAHAAIRWVLIERPAYGGTYRRHAIGRTGARNASAAVAPDLSLMHLATGVLINTAATAGREVILVPASTKPKLERHTLVYDIWPEMNSRKSSEDERDAVYLGVMALLDSRRRWAA